VTGGKIYVVMGVSGSGKTLIGSALARKLGVDFVDGDDFHPPENVRRMAAGIPLTDADRADWLAALASRIRQGRQAGAGLVVACSALKRSYRDVLREAAPDLQLVFLKGDQPMIAGRLGERRGHYMPASLLDSQFATLEEPSGDERAWTVDITQSPQEIVEHLVERASK
jgi:gluconokinase